MTPRNVSGIPLLRSQVIESVGVPHAFSTRQGGISSGIFSTLNFGNPSDLPPERRDPPEHIRENYRRLLEAAGCPGRALREVHQVHGAEVALVRGPRPDAPDPKADALITDDPACALAIRTADCVPVLLAAGDGCIVAAAHAGWRGVIAGVLPATLHAMRQLGAANIAAAIGPCIGPDAFEVGPEVHAEFRRVFGDAAPARALDGGKYLIDLRRALALQLHAEGIDAIDVDTHCTVGRPDLFFSHRRDRGLTGRMAAVIAPA